MIKTIRKGDWFEIELPSNWNGITIEELFRDKWEAPKKITHRFRMNGDVRVNGERSNWQTPLSAGDRIQLHFFEDEEISTTPTYMDIEVLYEDDHLAVFNKPAFMNTHPNSQEDDDTLLNAAVFHMQAAGENRNIRHVHRLDRETSGAILFAKHELAGAMLDRMLEDRKIKRTYITLVQGIFQKNKGKIQEPIGKDRHHATRRRVSASGQSATTHFEVLAVNNKKGTSLVKCWLDTGRTHQIRVHLSHIGHPIIGDFLYGGDQTVDRVALHAAKLEFSHPFTGEKIICMAPFDKEIFGQNVPVNNI